MVVPAEVGPPVKIIPSRWWMMFNLQKNSGSVVRAEASLKVDGIDFPSQRAVKMVEAQIENEPGRVCYAADVTYKFGDSHFEPGRKRGPEDLIQPLHLVEVLKNAPDLVEGEVTWGAAHYDGREKRICGQQTTRFSLNRFNEKDVSKYWGLWSDKHIPVDGYYNDNNREWATEIAVMSFMAYHPNIVDLDLMRQMGKLHSINGSRLTATSSTLAETLIERSISADWMMPILARKPSAFDWKVEDFNRLPAPTMVLSRWRLEALLANPELKGRILAADKVKRIVDILKAFRRTTPSLVVPADFFWKHLTNKDGYLALQNEMMMMTGWLGNLGVSALVVGEKSLKAAPHLTLEAGASFLKHNGEEGKHHMIESIMAYLEFANSLVQADLREKVKFFQIYLNPWSLPNVAGATIRLDRKPDRPKREEAMRLEMWPLWPRGFDLTRADEQGIPAIHRVLGGISLMNWKDGTRPLKVKSSMDGNDAYQLLKRGNPFLIAESDLLTMAKGFSFRTAASEIWNKVEERKKKKIVSLAIEFYYDKFSNGWIPFDYTSG